METKEAIAVDKEVAAPPAGAALATLDLAKPACPRYYSLDTWRGVACLLVVLYHSAFYEGFQLADYQASDWLAQMLSRFIGNGWAGVTIFFVISGYCITATVDATRRKPTPLKNYFLRRVKRIYPPY